MVGYDPPLDTFFAQVIDLNERRREEEQHEELSRAVAEGSCPEAVEDEPDEEREPFAVWVGISPRQFLLWANRGHLYFGFTQFENFD